MSWYKNKGKEWKEIIETVAIYWWETFLGGLKNR